MELIILAGGLGSRYGGEKQVDGFGPDGAWLMDYGLYDAWQAGFKRIIIIGQSTRLAQIETHVTKRWGKVLTFAFAEQPTLGRKKPWGTGHALLQAQPCVQGNFSVINADDFYGNPAYKQLYTFLKQTTEQQWAMVGYPLADTLSSAGTVSRGICHLTNQGTLERIEEQAGLDAQSAWLQQNSSKNPPQNSPKNILVSMNAWACTPLLFQTLKEGWAKFYQSHHNDPSKEYFLPTAIMHAMNQNVQVQVLPTTSPWLGVTYAADKPLVCQKLQQLHDQKHYPLPLCA